MKRAEEQKTEQPVNPLFLTTCSAILSLFLLCSPGYASTDITDNAHTAPAGIQAAAGFGSGFDLNSPWNSNVVRADFGSRDAFGFETAFNDDEAGYAETVPDAGTAGGAKQGAGNACTDSCTL